MKIGGPMHFLLAGIPSNHGDLGQALCCMLVKKKIEIYVRNLPAR